MPSISTLCPSSVPPAQPLPPPPPPAPTQAQPPMFAPPPVSSVTPMPASAKKRPTYAPPPYLNSPPAPPASSPAPVYNMPGMPPLPEPKVFQPLYQNQQTGIPPSNSAPSLASPQWSPPATPSLPPVTAHWFYQLPSQQETWKPFSVEDSTAIEAAYEKGSTSQAIPIRRCSWFHRSSAEGRWIPYEEEIAEKLEQ